MHEQAKIDEARCFLSQMRRLANERQQFNHNLSAFLAAARLVLQYALKEARIKPGGKPWCDAHIAVQPVLKFFKDKRAVSIHANPISPAAKVTVSVADKVLISESVSVTVHRKDGTVETMLLQSPPPVPASPADSAPSIQYEYFFNDWGGTEDVVTLCDKYSNALRIIVADGRTKGFLTP